MILYTREGVRQKRLSVDVIHKGERYMGLWKKKDVWSLVIFTVD